MCVFVSECEDEIETGWYKGTWEGGKMATHGGGG